MTPKRRWPNAAENARTESIAQAKKIIAQMAPMKDALESGKSVSSLELVIRIGRIWKKCHIHLFWIALIELDGLHQTENDQPIMGQHADIAIMIEKDPAIFRLHLENVAAEEH